ncbi:MAG: DUF86 domain-containing protein [Nitrospirales bacterium]|nr:MAG: DUF86 domain-containing protein [Nitrospirales bacterium]
MSKREPQLLIDDIVEAANKILKFTKDMNFETFARDEKTMDAVIRNFEIIGEASNRFPKEFKDLHKKIDWKRLVGFRNRIVHEYFGIDRSIVWNITQNYLPEMLKDFKVLIKQNK